MARCGCGSTCACKVVGSEAINVTGTGSVADPYVIAPAGQGKVLAGIEQGAPGSATILARYTDGSTSAPIVLPTTNLSTVGADSVGQEQMKDAAIGSAELIDGAVIAAKIAAGAITRSKMAPADPIVVDRGTWQPSTTYALYDRVEQGGRVWLAKSAHTSPTTFAAGNWIALSPTPAATGYGFRQLKRTTSQQIQRFTDTAIELNASEFGSAVDWSLDFPSRMVCKVAGGHRFRGHIRYLQGDGHWRNGFWKHTTNGGTVTEHEGGQGVVVPSVTVVLAISPIIRMAVGDYMEFMTDHNAGGPLGFDTTAGTTPVSVTAEYLGPIA